MTKNREEYAKFSFIYEHNGKHMFGFMGKFFKKKKNIFLVGEIYIDAYGRYSCSILTHNLFYGYFVV